MKRVATFEKVSYERFAEDMDRIVPVLLKDTAKKIYDGIMLPARATAGSAGYDFFMPFGISLRAGEGATIPTGIRAKISGGWVLNIYPRSGLGFKFCMRLDNTVGIIDSDYYYSENEGHIIIKFTNCGDKLFTLEAGKGFAQGIFLPFGITKDDDVSAARNGGFGSTG